MEQHAPTNLPFNSPAPVASGKDDCRKILPARIPALQMLACLLDSYPTTVSPSLTTPVPISALPVPPTSLQFSVFLCMDLLQLQNLLIHEVHILWAPSEAQSQCEGSEMTQTLSSILPPTCHCSTRRPLHMVPSRQPEPAKQHKTASLACD